MTLHMIKLVPDVPQLIRWADRQRLLDRTHEDDLGYALHAVLHAAFGDLAPRPFSLVTERVRSPELLGYTTHNTDALRDHVLSFADPEIPNVIGLPSLAGKPMPDGFVIGRRLGFIVRARPTVRTDRDGDRTRVVERDAYREPLPDAANADGSTRGEVYQAWLTTRLEAGGAAVERLMLERFCRSFTLRRDKSRRLRAIEGPDASFSGVLVVKDPAKVADLLAHGVGRHAAFGYGMLLLRPA
jgi:CRISPR system Cascade subunit CasE